MSCTSNLSQSPEYRSFRSSVPLKVIIVDKDNTKEWKLYDCGPKTVRCPLFCLPPASGTADIFFKQALALSAKGIRVISAEPPAYWNIRDFCEGFRKLLDHLGLDRIHIFGPSLGELLLLAIYHNLCGLVITSYSLKSSIRIVIQRDRLIHIFIVRISFQLESIPQTDLASRLTLNCHRGYVQAHKLVALPVTIIDVFDECALSGNVREELCKCYPNAKLAHLKSGGNFPYLSRYGEVNLHLQIHLRQFDDSPFAASERPLINRS
nr:maspardin-like [Leptinotarsa decemlineata]